MSARAQEPWPNKPIRLIVPFTPGGVTDTSGRAIADALGKRLGQQIDSWVGLLAPAGTPAAIVGRLNTELNAALNDPAVREQLRVMGIEATPGGAEQFREEMKRDLARYGPVVKAAGITIE